MVLYLSIRLPTLLKSSQGTSSKARGLFSTYLYTYLSTVKTHETGGYIVLKTFWITLNIKNKFLGQKSNSNFIAYPPWKGAVKLRSLNNWLGGSESTLTHWSLSWLPIADCALRFRTSILMMISIKFLRNSDLLKRKEHLSSSKTDEVRLFLDKSLIFSIENLWYAQHKSCKLSLAYHDCS